MARRNRKTARRTAIPRLHYPEDAARHDYLNLLFKAYQLMDQGVTDGIRLMEKKGYKLACGKGCASCCVTHRSIPVYPIELVGITWFAVEKITAPLRTLLISALQANQKGDPCVFLLDNACSIHLMRPLACRQFNVFNKVCDKGEDAYYTRREDVLTPLKKYVDSAFLATMPFYKVTPKAKARDVVKKGLHHSMAKELQQMNWQSLADKMVAHDANNSKPDK